MSLLLICPTKDPAPWVSAINRIAPEIDVQVWPDTGALEAITFALVWHPPPGALAALPNLKALSSMGAGIDHLVANPEVSANLPIARIVDPELIQSMTEYIVTAALLHFRDFDLYRNHQSATRWQPEPPKRIRDIKVGIMGVGMLGGAAATRLRAIGFDVIGWSRNPKQHPALSGSYAGPDELPAFLDEVRILVCLLPLTPKTKGILDGGVFALLQRGAYIINVARGAHLNEQDLLEGLDKGQLSGACLDVFQEEPLPASHPFWDHPAITVTPHIASITDPASAAQQVVENYRRTLAGKPLLNQVDLERGY